MREVMLVLLVWPAAVVLWAAVLPTLRCRLFVPIVTVGASLQGCVVQEPLIVPGE